MTCQKKCVMTGEEQRHSETLDGTLAVVGASYLQLPLVLKARELGLRTVCFAWADGAVCREACDEFVELSITEKERIAEACAARNVRGIVTIASDVAVPTVCHVAAKLGLPGNSERSGFLSTNKGAMREAFAAAGVKVPQFAKVRDEAAGEAAAEGIGYPVIVKPADRSGSMGVTKLERREGVRAAVREALACSLCGEAVVERFVEGAEEISIEGISHEGRYYPLTATDKVTTGSPHYVELGHHQPSRHPREVLERALAQAELGVKALEIREGATHSELMITVDGEVYVTEIGARMGGDFIGSDLVELSTGYDFVRGVIEVACGAFREPQFGTRRHSGVWFYSEMTKAAGSVIRRAGELPGIVRAELQDEQLRPLKRSADRSGYFIYAGDRRMEIEDFSPRQGGVQASGQGGGV